MNPNVLIADGDDELADLLALFLSEKGFEVETASDGIDCLSKLRKMRPEVLVLDLELHWGGSAGVLAWLNEECPIPYPKVVLTASAGYLLDSSAVFEPPVIEFLSKPYAPDALLECVSLGAGLELKGMHRPIEARTQTHLHAVHSGINCKSYVPENRWRLMP